MAIIATSAIAAFTGCSRKETGSAPTPSTRAANVTLTPSQRAKIHIYTVKQSDFHKAMETTGTVDFDNDQATTVLAPFGGPVSRLLVSIGQKVKAGDPLAEVDSPDFAAAMSAYRKALRTAKTLRRVADVDKDLFQHNGLAQREEEQAQTDAANAEADRDAALQTLLSLNLNPQTIKDLQAGQPVSRPSGIIRSPLTGTVVEKFITPGELLTGGSTPCFTVADLSRVWVMAQLFGSDLASVRVGDPAEVISGIGNRNFSGAVDNIAAMVNPDTRSVSVRVVLNNPGDFLKKQMYVDVRIQSRHESTGLLIPVSAILRDDENLPFVYVVQPDGSFAQRPVTLGYRTGDQYDIPMVPKPAIRLWLKAGSLSNSCKINERFITTQRAFAANGFDHEPDCRFIIAATVSCWPRDAHINCGRHLVAESSADGCLSRPFAADG